MITSKELVLKELSQNLTDQSILTEQKDKLEKRIILKLNTLGVKGTSYSEIIIKISGVRDKFGEAFAKVEELILRRDTIAKELNIIDETISVVSTKMKNTKTIEYKVLCGRIFDGLTLQEIADKEHFSLDRIKQVSAEISKKISCQ